MKVFESLVLSISGIDGATVIRPAGSEGELSRESVSE